MIEEWRDIQGYEGKYQVSNTGKVRSLKYNNTSEIKELKYKINRLGYKEVKLLKNNKAKNFLVSTLVGKTFLKNKNFKDNVIFKNNDKSNTSVENLKWAYYSERQHNAYNNGKRKKSKPTKTKISINGKNYKSYEEARRAFKLKKNTFEQRFYVNGWNIYEALEIPVGNGGELIG